MDGHAPLSPSELLELLASLEIQAETASHEAVFTVEQSKSIKAEIPGAHAKNLFVKDKKGRLFLISALHETMIDLKRTHEVVGGSGRLSFASAEQLMDNLGVTPGSVTPLAVVNDRAGRVTLVIDENLLAFERINMHPLINSMTTSLSRSGLLAFLRFTGHEPLILKLPEPQEAQELKDGVHDPILESKT